MGKPVFFFNSLSHTPQLSIHDAHHLPQFSSFLKTSFLIMLLATLVLAGCSGVNPIATPTTPDNNRAGKTTTLIVWHTFTDTQRETFEALAQDFHKVYPDLEINAVYVGSRDDLAKQFHAAVALGAAPDLILADRRQIAAFASQGALQPLEKFFDDSDLGLSQQDKSDFIPGALALGKFPTLNQRTYGMPFDQEPLVLFYNADLLKRSDLARAPRTWQEFAEYAKLVTAENKYGWAMRASADTLEAMLLSRGSALLTDAETRALFRERAGLGALKMISEMSQDGSAKLASSDDKAQREFASGNAAFYFGWLSELGKLRALQKQNQTSFEIGVGRIPHPNEQETWLLTRGDLFALPVAPHGRTDADRARDAWFLIRWLTAPTQSAQWVRETNGIPLRASTLQFLAPDSKDARLTVLDAGFGSTLPQLAPQPAHAYIDTIEEYVAGLWLQASQPETDARALLDDLAGRVNQILAVKP